MPYPHPLHRERRKEMRRHVCEAYTRHTFTYGVDGGGGVAVAGGASGFSWASKPAVFNAATICFTVAFAGSNETIASCSLKITFAVRTPGTDSSAACTRGGQLELQDMPKTLRVTSRNTAAVSTLAVATTVGGTVAAGEEPMVHAPTAMAMPNREIPKRLWR